MGFSSRFYRFVLGETAFHQSALLRFLDVSAGNACGQVGPDILGSILGQGPPAQSPERWEGGGGVNAERSWIGILACFPALARL